MGKKPKAPARVVPEPTGREWKPEEADGKKVSQEELEDRRDRVWELHLSGIPARLIGQQLNCSERSIWRDLKASREKITERLREGDPVHQTAEALAFFRTVRQLAMRDFTLTDAGKDVTTVTPAKTGLLRLALDANSKILDLFMDTGYIQRELGLLRTQSDGNALDAMSAEELEQLVQKDVETVERLMKAYLESVESGDRSTVQ